MPPRPAPQSSFCPPSHWQLVRRRLHAYRLALPERDVEGPSSWRHMSRSFDAETHRFHMLVGLMLSALAREATCAAAMRQLVEEGLTPQSVQAMGEAGLRSRIRTVSLCNNKARHITQTAGILLANHNGRVPRTFDEVIALPGVGPKMANLFFQESENQLVGFSVDTHVHRVSQRLGWVPATVKTPEDTRKCLESWLPRRYWREVHFDLVSLGQQVCRSRRPRCEACCVRELCPSAQHVKKE